MPQLIPVEGNPFSEGPQLVPVEGNPFEQPSIPADMAKSGGIGLAKGAIGMAGMGADARELQAKAINAASKAFGYEIPHETVSQVLRFLPLMGGATSEELQKQVEDVTGKFYEPKTTAGKYAQTVGEFAPGLIGGPAGLARRAVTQVVAPALASEAAGQLTEGKPAEPYVRPVAALAGSLLAHKATAPSPASLVPSKAAVKEAAQDTYQDLASANAAKPIAQSDLTALASDIRETLNRGGARPSVAEKIHAAVGELEQPATAGKPDVADLVAARENIKGLLGAPDRNSNGARIALQKIEKEIDRLAPDTMEQLRTADKNWAAFKANEALDKRLARADLRAAGEHSGLNLGNRIRQNVTNYLLSHEADYLSPENRAALEKVVKGTTTQNLTRFASNLLGGGGGLGSTLLGVTSAAGGTYSGHPELSLLPVGGIGVRMLSNRMIARQAQNAAAGIRGRSPLGATQASPTLPSAGMSGLLNYNNPSHVPPSASGISPALLSLLLSSPRLRGEFALDPAAP